MYEHTHIYSPTTSVLMVTFNHYLPFVQWIQWHTWEWYMCISLPVWMWCSLASCLERFLVFFTLAQKKCVTLAQATGSTETEISPLGWGVAKIHEHLNFLNSNVTTLLKHWIDFQNQCSPSFPSFPPPIVIKKSKRQMPLDVSTNRTGRTKW